MDPMSEDLVNLGRVKKVWYIVKLSVQISGLLRTRFSCMYWLEKRKIWFLKQSSNFSWRFFSKMYPFCESPEATPTGYQLKNTVCPGWFWPSRFHFSLVRNLKGQNHPGHTVFIHPSQHYSRRPGGRFYIWQWSSRIVTRRSCTSLSKCSFTWCYILIGHS